MEPGTFWFVAQHFNHCATAVPTLQSTTHKDIPINQLPQKYCQTTEMFYKIFRIRFLEQLNFHSCHLETY